MPSVVSISAYGKDGEEFGAGLIVGTGGEVVTALHLVKNATAIAVHLADGTEYPAVEVAKDAYADLVLLRMKAARALAPALIGDESTVRPGGTLLVVGNPFGLGGSVSRGILSASHERRILPDTGVDLLQTDAPINPGSSGGPVINLRGEVVGLVTSILSRSGGHQGVGFAVPATELRRVISFLRQGKPVPRARLGITVRVRKGLEGGVKVLKVAEDGPAQKAGLKPGDVLLRIGGRRVEGIAELRAALRTMDVGERVRLGIRRGDKLLDLWATTGALTKP